MNNAEWVNKRGYSFKDITAIKSSSAGIPFITIYIKGRPIETLKMDTLYSNDRFVLAWLGMEHIDKPILDDVERQYLSAVIRPFKKRVIFVRKDCHEGVNGNYEQIIIGVKSVSPHSIAAYIGLPFFKERTMYRGMRAYKKYTIEELGL